MPGSAQPRTQLLSQLRSGFTTQPTASLQQMKPSSYVAPTPAIQPPLPTPPQEVPASPTVNDNFFSTQEQLDTLEKVMEEVVAAKNAVNPQVTPTLNVQPPSAPTPTFEAPITSVMPQALNQSIQAAQQQASSNASPRKEVLANQAPVMEVPVAEVPQPEPMAEVAPPVPETAANTPAVAENTDANNQVEAGVSPQYQEVGPMSAEISPEIASYLQEVTNHQEQLPQEIVVANNDVTLQPSAHPLRPVIVLPITPEIEAEGAKKATTWSVRWLVEWSRRLVKMFSGKVVYKDEAQT